MKEQIQSDQLSQGSGSPVDHTLDEPAEFQNINSENNSNFFLSKAYCNLLDRITTCQNMVDDMQKMFQERLRIQNDFATSINQWHEKWKPCIMSHINRLTPACVEEEIESNPPPIKEVSPLTAEVNNFFKFLETEGKTYAFLIQRLEIDVCSSLLKLNTENYAKSQTTGKTFYENCQTDFDKNFSCWSQKYNKMLKAKEKYHNFLKSEDWNFKKSMTEGSDESKEASSNLSNTKKIVVTSKDKENDLKANISSKDNRRLQKISARMEDYLKSYHAAYDEVQSYFSVYKKNTLQLCDEFIKMEENFLNKFKKTMEAYSELVTLSNNKSYMQDRIDELKELSCKLQQFQVKNELSVLIDQLGFQKSFSIEPFMENLPVVSESSSDTKQVNTKSIIVPRNSVKSSAFANMYIKNINKISTLLKKSSTF